MLSDWLVVSDWTPETVTAAATVTLAFLTLVLAIGSIFLWLSTRRLVIGAEKTAERQLRAYITVGSHGIRPFRDYNQSRSTETIAHIGVRNVGQVPARDVRWFIDVAISADGRRADFPIKDEFFGKSLVVQPGTEMIRSQRTKLGKADIENIRSNDWFFYVWGEIRYVDGFNTPRFTRFCQRYDRDGIDDGPVDRISVPCITAESMRYHQYGNDAN